MSRRSGLTFEEHQIFAADENSSDGMLVLRCSPCLRVGDHKASRSAGPPAPTFWLSMRPTRSSTVSSRTVCSMSAITAMAPASVNASTKPAPIPLAPPVTSATVPWKSSTAPTLRPTELGAYQLLRTARCGVGLAWAVRVKGSGGRRDI